MNPPRFEIVQQDMGGWVRVFLGRGEPAGELARFLSHNLTHGFGSVPTCGSASLFLSTGMVTPLNFMPGTTK